MVRAQELLALCTAVYGDIDALCKDASLLLCDDNATYTDIKNISDPKFDVDAFVATRSSQPHKTAPVVFGKEDRATTTSGDVVVAVRGTESWKDIKADLKVCKSGKADASCMTRVHCGFLAHAYCLLDPVYTHITQASPAVVYLTGHSLGGATATLLAYMLLHLKTLPEQVQICVCTFGSPRVGNFWFREVYNACTNLHTTRFCMERDIITCMPCINYWHVGKRVLLQEQAQAAEASRCAPRLRLPLTFSAHKLDAYKSALADKSFELIE